MERYIILILAIVSFQNCFCQKQSLEEIETLWEGTWAPVDDDTIPYYYETYHDNSWVTRIKYLRDTVYLKSGSQDRYYGLSLECPPDSLIYWDFKRSDQFECVCFMLIGRGCEAITKITKDTLIIDDSQRDFTFRKIESDVK